MVKRKQADGSMIEDDAPAPAPAATEPTTVTPDDGATNNEDDKDENEDEDKVADEVKPEAGATSAAELKGGGAGAYEQGMSSMVADQLTLGSEFGEKFREKTGISKVTGAVEAIVTTPIKAAVGGVQAAPKAILYTAPKAVLGAAASGMNWLSGGRLGRLANTITGSPSNEAMASKLPKSIVPRPRPGLAQEEEERLERGRGNNIAPGGH